MEIRPFDWRDLTLMHRVRERGVCLAARIAYTRGPHAMQHALLDVFTPGRTSYTMVVRSRTDGEVAGVGQISLDEERHHAHVSYVSPVEIFENAAGVTLLENLARSAGERGAHNLIAEVDEDSPAFTSLRRSGFAIYARQRIWRRQEEHQPEPDPDGAFWRTEVDTDEPAIYNLYVDLVPALVQQVEALPSMHGRGLVHWEGDELLGYLDIQRGPLGVWVQPYFHPAAEALEDLMTRSLTEFDAARTRPWYICVRSYQGYLNATLEAMGFESFRDQAVMVKRLAAPVRRTVGARIPKLEGTRPEPTAPFMQTEPEETAGAALKR